MRIRFQTDLGECPSGTRGGQKERLCSLSCRHQEVVDMLKGAIATLLVAAAVCLTPPVWAGRPVPVLEVRDGCVYERGSVVPRAMQWDCISTVSATANRAEQKADQALTGLAAIPSQSTTPAPAAQTGGGRRITVWNIFGVVAASVGVLTLAIVAIIVAVSLCRGAAESAYAVRIGSRRVAMAAPNPPQPVGPASGRGKMIHHDSHGRPIGWEEWEYPASPPPT